MARKVVIRDCRKSDLFVLEDLVVELYFTDAGPDAEIPDIGLTFGEFKRKPDKGRLVVFERDSEIIGYAILVFFWSNEFGGDVIDIDEIVVTKPARGQGVGTAFFNWMKKEYGKTNSKGWSLQVKPGNKKAYRLYQNVGFQTSSNWHLYNIFAWHKKKTKPATRSARTKAVVSISARSAVSKTMKTQSAAKKSTGAKTATARRTRSANSKRR